MVVGPPSLLARVKAICENAPIADFSADPLKNYICIHNHCPNRGETAAHVICEHVTLEQGTLEWDQQHHPNLARLAVVQPTVADGFLNNSSSWPDSSCHVDQDCARTALAQRNSSIDHVDVFSDPLLFEQNLLQPLDNVCTSGAAQPAINGVADTGSFLTDRSLVQPVPIQPQVRPSRLPVDPWDTNIAPSPVRQTPIGRKATIQEGSGGRFRCSEGCSTTYRHAGACRRHLKMHNGPFFPCTEQGCPMIFYRNDKLQDHLRQRHNVINARVGSGRR